MKLESEKVRHSGSCRRLVGGARGTPRGSTRADDLLFVIHLYHTTTQSFPPTGSAARRSCRAAAGAGSRRPRRTRAPTRRRRSSLSSIALLNKRRKLLIFLSCELISSFNNTSCSANRSFISKARVSFFHGGCLSTCLSRLCLRDFFPIFAAVTPSKISRFFL